jgi:putative component of membrane protein insertase Oxa1/YidC/SpoIIIJ protein YidD
MPRWYRSALCPLALGAAALWLIGCAHTPAPRASNITDARYHLAARFGRAAAPSSWVRGYRRLLRRALASRCRWYPSDSVYYSLRAESCSATVSLYRTFGRILAEGSIAELTPTTLPVRTGGSFRWIQLPSSCP